MFDTFPRSKRHSRNHNRRKSAARNRRVGSRNAQLEPLESRYLLSTAPVMVADINQDTLGSLPGGASSYTQVGEITYMSADDGVHGSELWRTDGTDAGTWMVKDIWPDADSSGPRDFAAVGNTLFFVARDGVNGQELWKSDGTASGTVMVKDIHTGADHSSPNSLTAVDDTLFFVASDGASGTELWKSNGTEAGTAMVKDITPEGNWHHPDNLTAVGDTLFFSAYDDVSGTELWKSNGMASGTVMVKDIRPGSDGAEPQHLLAVGDAVYFAADDGTLGEELWKSDGTEAGTEMVKDIWLGANGARPLHLAAVDTTVYFAADDGTNGKELWKSNGMASGTEMVKDIWPDAGSSHLGAFAAMGNTLFFVADDIVNGGEGIWMSDGTDGGTVMVKNTNPGHHSQPKSLTAVGDTLFFHADDNVTDVTGRELWKSNGTETGTVLVADIWPGANGSIQSQTMLTTVDDMLYFMAEDGTHGRETWTLDTTSGVAAILKDIHTHTESSSSTNPGEIVELDGVSYFFADDGIHGNELWTSDGTAGGTHLVKDMLPGEPGSSQPSMESVGGRLVISLGAQLWASDGTAEGTVLLRDNFGAAELTALNDRVFFATSADATVGKELWSTDGTLAGTRLFADIRTGVAGSDPMYLEVVDGNLYFDAAGDDGQRDWWVTNGIDAPVRFADSALGSDFDRALGAPIAIDGTLVFRAISSGSGVEVWSISDIAGTDATPLTDINGVVAHWLTDVDNKAVFSTYGFNFPEIPELWASAGTVGTTERIAILHEDDPYGVNVEQTIAVGDKLYFQVATLCFNREYYDDEEFILELYDGDPEGLAWDYGEWEGTELWVTDGTAAGTHLVREFAQDVYDPENPSDYAPGPRITGLCESEGQLFFNVYSPDTGQELWTTDGTTATLVADVRPGTESSYPRVWGAIDGATAFTASDSVHGRELWRLLDDSDPNVSPDVTLPAGMGSVTVMRDGDDLVVEKDGVEQLRRAMGSIAGVTIRGAAESEDFTVDIDGLNASNLPNGLVIIAGEGTGDIDTLILTGSTTVDNSEYTTGGPEAGTITLDRFTVYFEEFEPILDKTDVVKRTFSIGTNESQKIVVGNDVTANGYSLIDDDGGGTFESVSFKSPTNSLAIVGGPLSDKITFKAMDDSFRTPISAKGGKGNDVIDASESEMPMVLSGDEGDDTLLGGTVDDTLLGGAGNDVLDGGLGSDDVDGGIGNNEVISDVADRVVVLNEEGTFQLNATFAGYATADIDWGDGASNNYPVDNDTVTGSHVYPTKGEYTVIIAAPDLANPEQTLTVYVTVNNVTPDVHAGDDQTIDEGDSVSMAGSFNDPGSYDAHTYVWDFGDGSPTVAGTLATDHVYCDSGTYTVTLTVADDESFGADSFTVTVNNVAPFLTLDADTVVVSQDTGGTNSGTYFDPGDDTVSLSASAGDLTDNDDGTWSWSFGATNDPTLSQQVVITAEDDDGATREVSFQLIVNTVPPGLANVSAGATIAEDGLVTLTGQITDPGSFSTLELQCDWGDGNVETFSYSAGTDGFSETHQYESGGVFAVQVTLTDVYGGESTAAAVVRATGARVHEGVLQVVGTSESDNGLIGGLCSQMLVIAGFLPGFWHVARFTAADIHSIDVFLGDGNDHAVVASSVPAKLDGGAGNDYLKGGRGDDILLGGAGNDLLLGNQGRDLMIGGTGRDRLVGNRDDDILIGGTTAYDANDYALHAIMAEWTSDRDYATRIDNLRGVGTGARLNEDYYLIAADPQQPNLVATVFDDDERDVLTGGQGFDWFFANYQHDDEGRRDRITDLKAAEFADDLDWIETIEEIVDPEA